MTSSQQPPNYQNGSPKDSFDLIHPSAIDLESINPGLIVADTLQRNHLIDLSPLSLIRVSGDQSQSFLQGQFSNDINILDKNHCQLHAYCNPKGRTLAIIRIVRQEVRQDKGFWMIVPKDISESLISRLKMFVMRAKVDIQLDTEHGLLGMVGKAPHVDLTVDFTVDFTDFKYRVDSVVPRHLIITRFKDTVARDTAAYLETGSNSLYHSDLWRWLDIQSGIPQVYAQTVGVFIPQTINLELVDGISFNKGCFPGQEIVARIKYLGKPKQRLVIAEVESNSCILPGDEIYSPAQSGQRSGQKSGLVVDAVKTGDSQFQLSAMVPATMVESGDLMIGSAAGPKLKRIDLPYTINPEK